MAQLPETPPNLELGVRYSEHKNDPPPGLVWRKAVKGETLGSIAEEYHIRWIDLALYNWHTAKPGEINWYMNHRLGCTQNNGKVYSFTGTEKLPDRHHSPGGFLLVPDVSPDARKGPTQQVKAVRGGDAVHDNKLQVFVLEWLGARQKTVSGKWLYVFSGQGRDFGFQAPLGNLGTVPNGDFPPDPLDQPDSAFSLNYLPGVFLMTKKAEKLEYEILITGQEGPSTAFMTAVSGSPNAGKPFYEVGSKWYALSDPAILKKALSDGRQTRTTHALRPISAVTLDLSKDQRYYFLLSPVQLGPQALHYAMDHPNGLTPLLKPQDAKQWDPADPDGPRLNNYVGPAVDDIKKGVITLPVIDPYAWAEELAESDYTGAIKNYINWLGIDPQHSGRSETIANLTQDTGWDLEKLYVAQMLKSVRDSPGQSNLDKELEDAAKWKSDLDRWEDDLIKRNAEISANAHRSLLQLIAWLDGPGHGIVETAILKDTAADSPRDAIDVGRGILHWAVVTDYMYALEPGVIFLRFLFEHPGSVPSDIVLKNLDLDGLIVKMTDTQKKGLRYAYPGVLMLHSLQDFLSPPPKLDAPTLSTGAGTNYAMRLADYLAERRDKLIKILNDSQILPAKLQPLKLSFAPPSSKGWQIATTGLNSVLDISDKFTTYIIDEKIKIPDKFGFRALADLEEWFKARPKFANFVNLGTTYGLKGASLIVSSINLIYLIRTARYDYQTNQSTVNATSYVQAVSGVTMAIQDVLAEVATLLKHEGMQRVFPQLVNNAGGPSWGLGAAKLEGAFGSTFAAVYVIGMIVAGITTIISMERSRTNADARGDYTAAHFYTAGVVGGALMVGGGVALGLALMEAGAIFSATGIGATVGIVLFFVGGILATIASIGGWWASSNDYQVFARKCFLGKQGKEEPRFDSDPPAWSHALTEGTSTWPIAMQKRAIHDLLGQFTVKTSAPNLDSSELKFNGAVIYEISLGVFMPGSTIEIALEYEKSILAPTTVRYLWDPALPKSDHMMVSLFKTAIYIPESSTIVFRQDGSAVRSIAFSADRVSYDVMNNMGALLTTVTIQYPSLPNVIRVARKLVMGMRGMAGAYRLGADDDTLASNVFE